MLFHLYDLDTRGWNRWRAVADEGRRRLTEQQIAADSPGTILRDVGTWLEFVGTDGLVSKSRNGNVPAERLAELNAKSSYPIELFLKRALLRDYPNLAGTFILLRVMDLLQVKGQRLVVGPAAVEAWRRLNCTEQYFALLEALLFHAQSCVLGGGRTREEPQAFQAVAVFLGLLSDRWRKFDRYESTSLLGPQGELPPWNLFVQQQLGLIELRPQPYEERERRAWGGHGWLLGAARLTPWGTAIAWSLLDQVDKNRNEADAAEAALDPGQGQMELGEGAFVVADGAWKGDARGVPDFGEDDAEWEEPAEEACPEPEFGILQPIFRPYFPEWEKVYARPRREVRSGTHIFKVSLTGLHSGDGSVWRWLAVPPDLSLDKLAEAILRAFKFDSDHLYDFRYRDQRGRRHVYNHPYCDEGPFTTEITVGETDLALKDALRFTFDYGECWQFEVRLERIDAEACQLRQPKVIESTGKAPEQYPHDQE